MKTQETEIKIIDKETRNGSTNGNDWTITEYTCLEQIEMENGSMLETKVKATAAKNLGELKVGGTYKAVMFITSRESEYNGKKSLWNSFRITRADLVGEPTTEPEPTTGTVDELDSLPF